MKKKKIDLGKKLLFTKETVATLNPAQQHQVLGGVATRDESICPTFCAETSPAPTMPCCR